MVSSRPSLSSSISNLQFPWFSGSGFYIFTTSNQTFTPESELALIWSNGIYAEPQANHWITCGLLGVAHTQTTWKENAHGVDRYRTKGLLTRRTSGGSAGRKPWNLQPRRSQGGAELVTELEPECSHQFSLSHSLYGEYHKAGGPQIITYIAFFQFSLGCRKWRKIDGLQDWLCSERMWI